MKKTLLALLFAAPLFAQTVTGRFEPGQIYREPDRDAPPAVSRMFVRNAGDRGVDLPATGSGGMIVVVPSRAGAAIASAHGAQRVPLDAKQDVIHIDQTAPRRYHLDDVARGAIVVASEPDSALTMTTVAGPLSRMPGQPVTLRATLRDGDEPVSGARVVARLTAPGACSSGDEIVLADKGNGDYAAVLDDLPSSASGFWNATFDAAGTTLHGVEFARSGSNQFMNERLSARLGRVRATVAGGVLQITADADVVAGGRYRLNVIVASRREGNGARRGIAWGEEEQTLAAGPAQLAIDVPIDGSHAEDVFVDVRLLDLDAMGVAGRVTIAPASERFAPRSEQ